MTARIEGVVMFTLVRFTHRIMLTIVSNSELCLFSVCVMGIMSPLNRTHMPWATNTLKETSTLARKMAVLLVSQCLIDFAVAEQTVTPNPSHNQLLPVIILTRLTCLLIIAVVVSHFFQDHTYLERSMTLLLYMYTDSSEALIDMLGIGLAGSAVAVLMYIATHFLSALNKNKLVQYFSRAFNMISINVVLNTINSDSYSTNIYSQVSLMLVVLFVIDCLRSKISIFDESRDYALWRSAQATFEGYQKFGVDPVISLVVGAALLGAKSSVPSFQHNHSMGTLVELAALVLVNMVLDVVTNMINGATTPDRIVVLFMYVISIHFITTLVVHWLGSLSS